jgi:polysaccharide biosynthesis protein PslG
LKKMYFCWLLLPMFLYSCSSTRLPSGGRRAIPEDFFGIVHAGKTREIKEEELLDEMGCKWVLNTFYWNIIEPEKGRFDFSYYDPYVNEAKKQGRKIIAVLGYAADYSHPQGKTKYYISKKNMPFFLRYVEEMVSRYKGQIDVWCIWNEPNILFWKGTDREYFELTKLAIGVIRKTDPNAYIIGGAFCRTPVGFIKRMQEAGAIEGLDALAFHPYAVNPSGSMRLYDLFTKTLSEINYSGQVWITEVGYPTGGWYPQKVSLNNYPSYIVKTITGAAARGARVLLWYQMFDSLAPGERHIDSENFFGLINKDYSRKAGSWAYELCARFLPGSRYVPELPQRENMPSTIVSFCFLDGVSGNNTLILWNDKKQKQKFELNLPASALLHDVSTGENTPLPADSFLDISDKPLIITWVGTETPCIIKKH